MIVYAALFGVSAVGIILLMYRYYREARSLSTSEIEEKLRSTPSIRSAYWDRFVEPTLLKVKDVLMPAFWRLCDKLVNRARIWVSKLEVRLKKVSDNIHGTAINLDVPEKSQYWQNLNGAKNGNGHSQVSKKIIIK